MATDRTTSTLAARTFVCLAAAVAIVAAALGESASAGTSDVRRAEQTRCPGEAPTQTTRFAARRTASRARPAAYGWPLKPFDRQHPVRAYFNDPRDRRTFHFGIDIYARDGTPVYAVAGGTVHMTNRSAVAVVADSGTTFGYWHIVPFVRHRQRVRTHDLLGWVGKGWGHVHFAERRDGVYANPLRSGGIGPYVDTTAPTVARVQAGPDHDRLRGSVRIVADAYDTTPRRVAPPWNDMPVTPALVRWRLVQGGAARTAWRVGVDFRHGLLSPKRYGATYAPQTRKNIPPRPGLYCLILGRVDTTAYDDGPYRLDVEASDTRGNRSVASVNVTIANGG